MLQTNTCITHQREANLCYQSTKIQPKVCICRFFFLPGYYITCDLQGQGETLTTLLINKLQACHSYQHHRLELQWQHRRKQRRRIPFTRKDWINRQVFTASVSFWDVNVDTEGIVGYGSQWYRSLQIDDLWGNKAEGVEGTVHTRINIQSKTASSWTTEAERRQKTTEKKKKWLHTNRLK